MIKISRKLVRDVHNRFVCTYFILQQRTHQTKQKTDKQRLSDIEKSDLDPLFEEVSVWTKPKKQISIDQIQQKFAVGYIRAGRILEQLKVTGIVK